MRAGGIELMQSLRVRPEGVSEHSSVPTVVLGTGGRKPIPEAIQLLGVDGVDLEFGFHHGFHDRAVRHLDGDPDLMRCGVRGSFDPLG